MMKQNKCELESKMVVLVALRGIAFFERDVKVVANAQLSSIVAGKDDPSLTAQKFGGAHALSPFHLHFL